METLTLAAEKRTEKGRKTYVLRQEGLVPAVVYGGGVEPKNVSVNAIEFEKAYREGGESTLIDLSVAGEQPFKVLIQDIQRDPILGYPIHIDFRNVDMNKPIEASIELVFVGESAAVKQLGGTFIKAKESIDVKCLPANLVSSIDVDISKLATFDDVLHARDIQIPEGMEVLTDLDRTIAVVEPPRTEEEMAALDEAVVEDVEGVADAEAKEGEEGAAEGEEQKDEGADAPAEEKKDE